jgi:hypothetical protein
MYYYDFVLNKYQKLWVRHQFCLISGFKKHRFCHSQHFWIRSSIKKDLSSNTG